jgi:hypothetical protein
MQGYCTRLLLGIALSVAQQCIRCRRGLAVVAHVHVIPAIFPARYGQFITVRRGKCVAENRVHALQVVHAGNAARGRREKVLAVAAHIDFVVHDTPLIVHVAAQRGGLNHTIHRVRVRVVIRIDDRSIQVGTNPTRDQCMRLAYRHIVEQDAADALRNLVQRKPPRALRLFLVAVLIHRQHARGRVAVFVGNAYTNPRVCPIGTAPTFSRAQAKALARVTKDGADRTMRAVSIREHMANEADKLEALAANLRAIPDNV